MDTEKDTEKLLRKAGFKILGTRPKETIITLVDGREHVGSIEADYRVRREGKDYVAFVHYGEIAADPNDPDLRRRLLECSRAFPGEKLLLVDQKGGQVHLIDFRFPHEFNLDFLFRFLVALLIIFLVVGIIWVLATIRLF